MPYSPQDRDIIAPFGNYLDDGGEGEGEERQLIDLRLALPQVKTKRDQPVR